MAYVNNPLAMRTITGAEDFAPEEQALRENAKNVGQLIVEEGCVLLKNDGTLPLQTDRVNVFGAVAANPFFGGRGSACADNSFAVGFFTALEEKGIQYNQTLYNLYKNWAKKGKTSVAAYPQEHTVQKFKKASVMSTVIEVFSPPYVKELPAAKLSNAIMQEAAAFSDTAIVMLGRSGSEQHDMKPEELRLFQSERAMLDKVCGSFAKVIVLINTADVMELGFLEEYPQIRAALSIGFTARTGMRGVIRILKGEVSPSGRTVDTWYYRTDEHPAFQNSGTFSYINAPKRHFLMYKEDIYVGYRYAETFLDDALYDRKIQFPFGYGLSYTNFRWNEAAVQVHDQTVKIQLNVTNVGSHAGKDVVEIYVRPPYTGKIEKPRKVLAAFAKTKVLAPKESEVITLNFSLYDIASFDTANGCYVLEPGEYITEIAQNAHESVIECSFKLDEVKFSLDPVTHKPIVNRFCDFEGDFRKLTRNNLADFVPEPPQDCDYIAPEGVVNYLKDPLPVLGGEAPRMGEDYGVKLSELKNKDWNDPLWEKFLSQFTPEEMIHLITHGGYQTTRNERLGLPETVASDGPGGIHDSVTRRSGISYPSGTTIASTWNVDLAQQYGCAVGSEASFMHVQEWYAPSLNIHRSPFGGRCFEYYSEDPLLVGKIGAAVVRGAQSQGLICHIKHFALNEEDAHRLSVHTWCSEQAIREIYTKPFEIAVKEGGANGVMSALNCIGVTWAGECKPLLTGLLREEWDFHGCVVTDFANMKYQRCDFGVLAGNDLWLAPMGNGGYIKELQNAYRNDPEGMGRAMQKAVKNICYMVLQTKCLPEN